MGDIVVIGLGNTLMSDEGVGVIIVQRLMERKMEFPDVDFADSGTSGIGMLHLLADRRKAIIIDCAYTGSPPGAITRFTPEQVRSMKDLSELSLHEADALGVIELSRQLGECPDEVVLFGIEPERVAPGVELSETLRQRLEDYVRMISEELTEGITGIRKS